jgi:hypothetical protein
MAKKRKAKFVKGSRAAKEYMARLRSMVGKKRKSRKSGKAASAHSVPRKRKAPAKKRSSFKNPRPITDLDFQLNQLRNKGRRLAKKAGKKPFFFTGKQRNQLILSEGEFMAKRRSRKRSRKAYGFEGRRARRSSRKRRGVFMGGMGGGGMKGITKTLMQGAVGAAGAVGSAYLSNMIPQVPAKLKPAIPLAVAILLLTMGKKIPMSQALAFGAAVSGVLGFAKQFIPNMPALAGVETAPELTQEELAVLGGPTSFGAVQQFTGDAVTPADL